MGEELELGKLFIKNDDGTFSELMGGIVDCSIFYDSVQNLNYGAEYFQIPNELFATISFNMSHKQKREFDRMLRRSIGHYRRTIRRFIRLKEKVRRNMLKRNYCIL